MLYIEVWIFDRGVDVTMRENKCNEIRYAFMQSVPVMLGYVFLGIAFGLMLQDGGYSFWWAFVASALIYAGTISSAGISRNSNHFVRSQEKMEHTIGIILVVAICTLMTRALPFLIFGGKKDVPSTIQYLGKVLPSAIMIILVVYCLKNIDFTMSTGGIPEFLAIAVVVILHLWKKNPLLSIGVGTIFYMLMV